MREILFRGKQTSNGDWHYGYYCVSEKFNNFGDEHFIIEYPCYGGQWCVIPETVGQYTGLTDKNGNKIFEGDIIKTHGWRGQKFSCVTFKNGMFYAYGMSLITWTHAECQCEVVGNIHDNPELLNEVITK